MAEQIGVADVLAGSCAIGNVDILGIFICEAIFVRRDAFDFVGPDGRNHEDHELLVGVGGAGGDGGLPRGKIRIALKKRPDARFGRGCEFLVCEISYFHVTEAVPRVHRRSGCECEHDKEQDDP